MALVERVDPLNFTTVKIQTLFGETTVGDATGFFCSGTVDGKPNLWLVTNWHVLSGRNTDDPNKVLHKLGAIPNRLRISLVLKDNQGAELDGAIRMQELFISLYNHSGNADWYQHTKKKFYDVAVISMGGTLDQYHAQGINDVANNEDMAVQIGSAVFILGYPLGFSHFINMPIWKRGLIASEPSLETPEARARVVIDATTRGGMSGAPVVLREKTHYVAETGIIKEHMNATRWIGVYASRPNLAAVANAGEEEDRRAEVGYFYKKNAVHETIVGGVRGPNFGELP